MTQQLDRIENKLDDFISTVGARAIDMEGRVKVLETNQSHAAWVATWLSGIVASIVAAAILSWRQVTGQ
jgi:hypothetical protein